MSAKHPNSKIRTFIGSYVKSKKGELIEQSGEIFSVKYPNQTSATEYTYEPSVAREKKKLLIAPGSPIFKQILDDCLENGILCQVKVNLKGEFEALLKNFFKDSPVDCQECQKIAEGNENFSICEKTQSCYHQINNGKIVSVKIIKEEPVRFYQFYFSAVFRNKLRLKNEELITILIDENANIVSIEDFSGKNIWDNEAIEIQDFKAKLNPMAFDELKGAAEKELVAVLKEKLVLFDLPLSKEKEGKLKSFDRRLRRERIEQAINNKYDLDLQKWQATYEALMRKEEESLTTNIAVKFINLLVINTSNVSFELKVDNNATIRSAIILGINHIPEVNCQICRNALSEGYATEDSFYVCENCIRQSIDTGKIYSKKAPLKLDETLNEYFEQDAGFVCSVCGKKHSRLLENSNAAMTIQAYAFFTSIIAICAAKFSQNLT